MVPTDHGKVDIVQHLGSAGNERVLRGGDPHITINTSNRFVGRVCLAQRFNSQQRIPS